MDSFFPDVNDHPNGATHDRLNGAISNWPKSVFRLFKELIGAVYRLIADRGAVIFTTPKTPRFSLNPKSDFLQGHQPIA